MSKQYSQYFNGVIEALVIEPKKYLERVSFWKYIERTKDEYFMICLLEGSKNFKLKVEIKRDEYEKSKVGDHVSINLDFKYNFTCFYYKEEKKENILTVEEEG